MLTACKNDLIKTTTNEIQATIVFVEEIKLSVLYNLIKEHRHIFCREFCCSVQGALIGLESVLNHLVGRRGRKFVLNCAIS